MFMKMQAWGLDKARLFWDFAFASFLATGRVYLNMYAKIINEARFCFCMAFYKCVCEYIYRGVSMEGHQQGWTF